MPIELHPTSCALCGTTGDAALLYPATFSENDFNAATFSARRRPDRIHYRMVRCTTCGLVRSDPVADASVLDQLYAGSEFDYATELANLKQTYGRFLRRAVPDRAGKALLEIGCGNGFILEEALRSGFAEVRGVEPGRSAVEAARPEIRDRIICDVMRPGLFEEDHFDVVALFQILDHIPDPEPFLFECLRVLKPGGLLVAVNHDVSAISARILGERSPIIDIEHTYLFDTKTMRAIVSKKGFEVVECGSFWNTYSLAYLIHLLPMPRRVKDSLATSNLLRKLRLTVPLGNLYLVARKPEHDRS